MQHPIPPKAIVFDLDGTLVNSNGQVLKAFGHALEPFGVKVSGELLEKVRSRSQHDLFEGLIHDKDTPEALRRLSEFAMSAANQVELFVGLRETVEHLRAQGVPMAVWTGRDALTAQEILQNLNLSSYFKKIVAGCHVKKNKPHPEGLMSLVGHFGLLADEVLMIGDHAHDILGAKGAGCRSALACWGREDGKGQENLGADHTFMTPDELHRFVKLLF